jgi:hypothetical protein
MGELTPPPVNGAPFPLLPDAIPFSHGAWESGACDDPRETDEEVAALAARQLADLRYQLDARVRRVRRTDGGAR